jgi:hypothetical protein
VNAPTLSEEILYGRPPRWKIFVSSKMQGDPLRAERETAVSAIESTPIAQAWCWERHARAGEYCAVGVCVGHARTSDGLVLILGDTLTPITHQEFTAAGEAGAARFILIQDGVERDAAATEFIRRERDNAVTKNFANLSELRKHIIDALTFHAVNSGRRQQLARLARPAPSRIRILVRLGLRRRGGGSS